MSQQPRPERQFGNSGVRHGTTTGARLHNYLGQDQCLPCFTAKQEYDRRRREATDEQLRNRRHAKAQRRALARLQAEHPDAYRRYYEEERDRINEEEVEDDTLAAADQV